MKRILYLLVVFHLILAAESVRHRRQYVGYGPAQQYASQHGLYGPGGQGWMNNNLNNRFPNQPGYNWNNNFNWNHGHRRPEWYYNAANIKQSPIVCLLFCTLYNLIV
ncbi:unnamed protein product [Rotaria magnacalcarata]|uniref:Uncharacterized protein n=1 Tax=Rotaria magnacalcarata TaxID=392030 RepID=A0A819W5V3_9BILA|nr:unnamed protein product [Rotaria magnacalcarata]CAF2124887.1 unnamed protein product [Rotaria magnacalcarata]CAF2168202.1 unnamed protein product [Rotaria magnacalcarata]CAF3952905.1 unnamed protein product [Rotaria magnacalcarata]CAF4016564.1 unnamed protein product [Rotaria magnacalcarata]